MQISTETIEKVVSRVWHLALVAGFTYASVNPKYAWAIPLLGVLGQASNPPK
jgi:hypothetical protein